MFPNIIYVWERFKKYGAQLHLVPSDDGMTIPTERMLAAIDEQTAIVSISHGIYVSGSLQDIKAICKRAHEVGAIVMVDGYQTIGAMPLDVKDWDADIMVGGSHKWLCGGPGTCFMWMKPEVAAKLEPKTTGWMAHAAPFAFEDAPHPLRRRAVALHGRHPLRPRLLRRPRSLQKSPRGGSRTHSRPQLGPVSDHDRPCSRKRADRALPSRSPGAHGLRRHRF